MKLPPREVLDNITCEPAEPYTDKTTCPVYVMANEAPKISLDPESVFTQENDPYKPERVRRIIEEVLIGLDITQDQHQGVMELIREYVDCFALSLKEVNAIPGAVHKLNIPEGATFRTKIPPRHYNPGQRAFVNTKVNEMLKASIIRPIHPSEVRFVA